MIKTFIAILELFDSNIWGHHIKVPLEISAYFNNTKIKRLKATIEATSIQCALMPAGDGQYFININKAIRKELSWTLGEAKEVVLEKNDSKYGIEIAEELEVLLDSDPEGSSVFHGLTPGKQRSLIYIVSSPKRSETRVMKSIIMLDYLKSVQGQLDFKELNQAFKDKKSDFQR